MTSGVGLLMLGFVLYCVLDIVLTDEARIRNLPKLLWLLLVVLLPMIGGVAWLVAGRPARGGRDPGGRVSQQHPSAGGPRPRGRGGSPARPANPPRPRGPDDDPEFLRRLDDRLRRRDEDDR